MTMKRSEKTPVKVLFVCMGNICRSPTAEALFRHAVENRGLSDHIQIESAGTDAWHVGEAPDERSQMEALKHGIDMSGQTARKVNARDYHHFDYILAMDDDNLARLVNECPDRHRPKVRLFTEFAPQLGEPIVPDPYYGSGDGFARVFRICQAGSEGLLNTIAEDYDLSHE